MLALLTARLVISFTRASSSWRSAMVRFRLFLTSAAILPGLIACCCAPMPQPPNRGGVNNPPINPPPVVQNNDGGANPKFPINKDGGVIKDGGVVIKDGFNPQ